MKDFSPQEQLQYITQSGTSKSLCILATKGWNQNIGQGSEKVLVSFSANLPQQGPCH